MGWISLPLVRRMSQLLHGSTGFQALGWVMPRISLSGSSIPARQEFAPHFASYKPSAQLHPASVWPGPGGWSGGFLSCQMTQRAPAQSLILGHHQVIQKIRRQIGTRCSIYTPLPYLQGQKSLMDLSFSYRSPCKSHLFTCLPTMNSKVLALLQSHGTFSLVFFLIFSSIHVLYIFQVGLSSVLLNICQAPCCKFSSSGIQ